MSDYDRDFWDLPRNGKELKERLPSPDCIPGCSCLTLAGLGLFLGMWETIRIKIQMNSLTPHTQFKKLENRCEITWSKYVYSDDENCIDYYKYGFKIKRTDDNFESANQSLYRWPCVDLETRQRLKSTKEGSCDDCGGMRNATLRVGQSVHCWRPRVYDLPPAYKCGNDECYKIQDPEDDLYGAIVVNAVRFYGGMLSCFVSCIYGCCLCCGCCECCFRGIVSLGEIGDTAQVPTEDGSPPADKVGKPVAVNYMLEEQAAATRIQAVHRGRAARSRLYKYHPGIPCHLRCQSCGYVVKQNLCPRCGAKKPEAPVRVGEIIN